LCGFSIWREDRSKIAGPIGAPALQLAVTDTEIREYAQMFRAGHFVTLGDLIGGLDVLYVGIVGKGSIRPELLSWLQPEVPSANPSARALNGFLRDLSTFRPRASGDPLMGDAERLDPIQVLLILRVVTEDMVAPVRQALSKMKRGKPRPLFHGQPATPDVPTWGEPASAGGPRVSSEPPPQAAPELEQGWAEDAYAGGVTGLYGSITTVLGLEKTGFGRYAERTAKANAVLTIVKFIATYTFLKGDMRVEAPGQPLIRTTNRSPGDRRTVVARFMIDGTRVTDWMKDHRQLVALAGLDIDMPKSGALKGVRTEWQVNQSRYSSQQIIQPLDWTGSLYKVNTDENGEASVVFVGSPQPIPLDPKTVMPIERQVTITVTPQIKATEMKQDLVDAVFGAIGIKDGPSGFVAPVMETLYRMNWTGETSLRMRVRDWQQAETIGQFGVEIRASGREFRTEYAIEMSLDRSLSFNDTEMRVVGVDTPPPIDPEVLKGVAPAQRALMQSQMEAYIRQMSALAQERLFVGTGPGTARMAISDVTSLFKKDDQYETSEHETLTGAQSLEPSPAKVYFTVKVDMAKKIAIVQFVAGITATDVTDAKYRYWPPAPADLRALAQRPDSHQSRERSMNIFSGLRLQSPFDVGTQTTVIPLKEEPVIEGGGAMNYYGAVPIRFTFGPNFQFKGTALLSYSVTRKVVKPKPPT
jgi:hypothetical protein